MRRQIRSTTSSSRPRIAAIEPGFLRAASAIASPRSRTSAIASSTFSAPAAASAANSPTECPTTKSGLIPRARADGETRCDESRLLDLRLDELFFRPLEAKMLQVEPGRDAAPLEDVERLGVGRRDLPAHADLERSLSRETEGNPTGLHC